jgi:hypothetical protein
MPDGTTAADASDGPDHTEWCKDHEDPTLDCSSTPERSPGTGGTITSWLTRTRGTDYAVVASITFTRPALTEHIAGLQRLLHQML